MEIITTGSGGKKGDYQFLKESLTSQPNEPLQPHIIHDTHTKTTDVQAFMNTIKSFVGVGILALPYGIKQSGVLAGIIGLLLIGLASSYTIKSLIRCKHEIERQKRFNYETATNSISTSEALTDEVAALARDPFSSDISYGEVGNHIFGKLGLYIVNFAIISSQVGICCAYVIFIGGNMNSMVPQIPARVFSLLLFPFIALLSWLRTLKFLAPTSIFANMAMLLGVSVVFYYGFSHLEIRHSYPFLRVETFPIYFGLAVFGMEGINLAIPIESSMKHPQRYNRVLDISIVVVVLMYLLFATFGYMFFGDDVDAVITLNLPKDSVIVYVVKASLILELIFSYPVQLFPVLAIMETPIFKDKTMTLMEIKRSMLRTLLVAVSVAIAIFIPYFDLFTSLIGSFSNSMVGFIFPPMFVLSVFRGRLSWLEIILNIFILVVGIAASAVSSSLAIFKIIETMRGETSS